MDSQLDLRTVYRYTVSWCPSIIHCRQVRDFPGLSLSVLLFQLFIDDTDLIFQSPKMSWVRASQQRPLYYLSRLDLWSNQMISFTALPRNAPNSILCATAELSPLFHQRLSSGLVSIGQDLLDLVPRRHQLG